MVGVEGVIPIRVVKQERICPGPIAGDRLRPLLGGRSPFLLWLGRPGRLSRTSGTLPSDTGHFGLRFCDDRQLDLGRSGIHNRPVYTRENVTNVGRFGGYAGT